MNNFWINFLVSDLFKDFMPSFVAGVFGTLIMDIIGKPLIAWLKIRKGMKWAPREDTPDTHLQKLGTPSMGGIGIIGAAVLGFLISLVFSTLIFNFVMPATLKEFVLSGRLSPYLPSRTLVSDFSYFLIFPAFVVGNAFLGYIDDHSKATNKGGLSSKAKLLGQILLTLLFLVFLEVVQWKTPSSVGLLGSALFDSWMLPLLAFLLIIGTSNAVNLTDGIDGLAAGLSVQAGLIFALLSSDIFISSGSFTSLSTFLLWPALGGACLGFLAFNKYPAKVFMGDTGSLALGAALGAGAILTRTVWLLPFVGFIFYVEMFSVIAQVLYFKYTRRKFGEGKRLFRRAPLHHHFELSGWSEWRVVATFWGVNLITTIIGLVLWKMGILPLLP